ncbi:epimerase [Pseudofrankia sp. EUN1h]|nr:epimerase [Pseudofrankia sp. EUN1h]
MSGERVLVTGGTGYLGVHTIAALLRAGYAVRASVRTLEREGEIRGGLATAGLAEDSPLELVVAELSADDGWARAVQGARFVLHVASPFPPAMPESDDEVIVPARDGALRVLRAARDAGVARVVMTSSFAAVGYGHPPRERAFTEEDWTNIDAPLSAYIRSKAVAERAAWDFIASEGGGLELVVVNPVGIFGPPLVPDLSASTGLARQMITAMTAVPRLFTTVVDVRDVADLHLRAMTDPAAAGERFLASSGEPIPFTEMAKILREAAGLPDAALPLLDDDTVREAAKTDPGMAGMVGELGKVRRVSSEKAGTRLGWRPRSNIETLQATATAFQQLGLLTT